MISWEQAIAEARKTERDEEVPPPPPGLFTHADVLERIEAEFPHCVDIDSDKFYDHLHERGVNIYEWCEAQFGPEAFEWDEDDRGFEYYKYNETCRWTRNDLTFCFREENDAMLYKVMWG